MGDREMTGMRMIQSVGHGSWKAVATSTLLSTQQGRKHPFARRMGARGVVKKS